jgi:dienelactone hydrolase
MAENPTESGELEKPPRASARWAGMPPPARCLVAVLAVLSSLTGCFAHMDVVIPPQAVPDARPPEKPLTGILTLPSGKGPFPAIVVLHGCDGVQEQEQTWAARLNGWGYAALIVDSYTPRGISSCGPQGEQPPLAGSRDRAGDALSAALWLRTRPEIDGTRIGVFGSSVGGSIAGLLTQQRYEQLFPGLLKASVNYYGRCWNPKTQGSVPLLDLVGEADDWNDFGFVRTCRAFGANLPPGKVFEMHTYPGAAHDFDDQMMRAYSFKGHLAAFDGPAAWDSFDRTKAFMDRYVGSQAD